MLVSFWHTDGAKCRSSKNMVSFEQCRAEASCFCLLAGGVACYLSKFAESRWSGRGGNLIKEEAS
jgi:hypothetical protein